MLTSEAIWRRFFKSFFQVFPWFDILEQKNETEFYRKKVADLERMVTETCAETRLEIGRRSKRLLELHQALLAVEKQLAAIQRDAVVDPLTGALNRRGANKALLRQVKTTQRALKGMTVPFPCFAVVVFDLDHFKLVNDTFGHPAGDQVLVTVVEITRSIFNRDTDIVCRPGGDEFWVIIPNFTFEQAAARAEMFRAAIANDPRLRFETFGVTASVGVAQIVLTETSKKEEIEAAFGNAIAEADQAALHVKQNGRDGVAQC